MLFEIIAVKWVRWASERQKLSTSATFLALHFEALRAIALKFSKDALIACSIVEKPLTRQTD